MEKESVSVAFRADNYGVTAVFADGPVRPRDFRTCYSHDGQHSSCNKSWYQANTRPATPEEYAPLLAELERIGYAVTVVARVRWVA